MRKIFTIVIGLFLVILASSCGDSQPQSTFVELNTDLGTVLIKLYDDTPIHKKNFIELVNNGYYDGVIFHRIVQNFMVQAGDASTKEGGVRPGDPVINYTLSPEFSYAHIHTAGKVAAAREPDEVNPEKRSSGHQFYIVTGRPISEADLSENNDNINAWNRARLYEEFQKIEQNPDNPIDFDLFLSYKGYEDRSYYDQTQKNSYKRLGGTPHLDFQYTIFGEVVTGMDIVKRIEQVPTEGERPLKAIRITSARVMNPEEVKP